MNLENIAARFQDTVRRHGIGAALHDVECRVLNKVTRFEILRAMVVEPADVTDPAMFEAPGYSGRFVDADELESHARAGEHELDPDFLAEARRRSDRCYALYEGTELASYGWYARQPTPIDEHFVLHFDPDYTYMFKGYTVPAHRGKRLHAVGMSRALRDFGKAGGRGLVSYVASNNFASLKSTARMGYRLFGDVYLVRAAGRSFAYASPGCRAYGFKAEALPNI
ncbi:MAG TPA: GNAT family acetyltransferase [Polyangia bacterium]|nr:GNAT family acetyltransferase [Polyangia bacterium]